MRVKQIMAAIGLASLTILAGFLISGGGNAKASTAYPCSDSYAIMCNGATSPQQFINKANTDRAGDLQNLYSNFGLAPADYSRYASSAQHGTLNKDGSIVVNGEIVGYSTLNISRTKNANFNQKVSVNGQTYWGGAFGSTYHADTAPVTVLFNDSGVMQFVVIDSCGNPQRFNALVAKCDTLHSTPVSGTNNRYSFTSSALIYGGAQVTKAVYDFGDGTPTKTVSDLSQAVEHTFTQNSTVTVNITFSLPGGGTVTKTSTSCATQITYKQPVKTTKPTNTTTTTTNNENVNLNENTNVNYNSFNVQVNTPQNSQAYCSNLTADLIDSDNHTYRFTATAYTAGGARLNRADFKFDDVSSSMAASPNGNTVIVQHNYADSSSHAVTAVLHFVGADNQPLADASCATTTPGAQQAKIVTAVATTNTGSLTKTGVGTVVLTIFGGAAVIATVSHYFIRRRLLV